jgi:uncharacterized repeat protein (TIGR03803 family)
MKNIYLYIAVLMVLTVQFASAQTQLWGACNYGGTLDSGTIFTADGNGNNLHAVYSCNQTTGAYIVGSLCKAGNNKLYGVTTYGGCNDSCVCFSYNPITGVFTDFHDLFCDQIHGWGAMSGMTLGADGNLYGICGVGGLYGYGVIYQINTANDTYADVYDFTGTSGAGVYGAGGTLTQLSDGKFYGMMNSGGANNAGVIFNFDPTTSTYTLLYSLDTAHGMGPYYGGLMQADNGKLYGMTQVGGANNDGVLFSYDLTTSVYTDLYDFASATGYSPLGNVIQATNGMLYGMTNAGGSGGGGVIFSFNITTNTYTDLFNFNGINGANPQRGLVQATNGLLYGTTYAGGAAGLGVTFSYDISLNACTILANMDGTVGANPSCDIIETPMLTTGVAAVNNDNLFSVYPNPVNSVLNINYNSKTSTIPSQLVLSDVLGNIIYQQTITQANTILDVSNWSKGVYMLGVTNDKETFVKKLVIQ